MKTILITGASSGIGLATAFEFAKSKKYRLVLCARRKDRLQLVKNEISKLYSTQIELLNFDVREYSECERAIQSIPEPFKTIDVLLNNAGLALGLDFIQDGNLEHWNTMIDTNVKGLLYMTRLISKNMIQNKSGHIINICSTAGKEVYPKGNVYCASKFAVDALTKAIRQDLVQHGIRVSQVAPGHVEETEFAITRFEGDVEKSKIYEDFNPLRASDIAEIIYFIANRPAHVAIQDVVVTGTQQANGGIIHRSGRVYNKG